MTKKALIRHMNAQKKIGTRGFEPPAPASRTLCATKLRYVPYSSLPALRILLHINENVKIFQGKKRAFIITL